MIKLKKILKEISTEDLIPRIANIVDTDVNPIVKNTILYRSTNEEYTDFITKKTIRKNRTPRDSHHILNKILEAFRLLYFNDLPSRYSVLFVTTSFSYSTEFGSNQYAALPSKNCKLYYFASQNNRHVQDTINYFPSIPFENLKYHYINLENSMADMNKETPEYKRCSDLYIDIVVNFKDIIDMSKQMLMLDIQDWKSLLKSLMSKSDDDINIFDNKFLEFIKKHANSNSVPIDKFLISFENVCRTLSIIYKYWTMITPISSFDDIPTESTEIQIFGDYVYLIDYELYEDYYSQKTKKKIPNGEFY